MTYRSEFLSLLQPQLAALGNRTKAIGAQRYMKDVTQSRSNSAPTWEKI